MARIARAGASPAHGVLLLDKPAGITSTRALAVAKRVLGAPKAGHAGTLDPFATGLLPLVFGEAAKFARFLVDAQKTYEATLRLGEETASGDPECPVTRRSPVSVTAQEIDAVLATFLGEQRQVPPMHSAIHVGGRRLYEYARAGEEIERTPRAITIAAIAALGRSGDDLAIRVTCSKGTYVRTLAQDIGRRLGCGAHLVALRRTAIGHLSAAAAVTLARLEALGAAARGLLLPPEALVAALPRFDASAPEAAGFAHGRPIATSAAPGSEVAVYAPGGRFLGVGTGLADRIAPLRLISPPAAKSPDFA